MREIYVELTPQAVAQIRQWLLLLESADAAPTWDPANEAETAESVQAVAQWVVDNGHDAGLGRDLVAVLLALFSFELQSTNGADHGALVDLERLARECQLGARSPSPSRRSAALAAAKAPWRAHRRLRRRIV
jgi:hypothetical protein